MALFGLHIDVLNACQDDGFGAFTNAEGDPVRFDTDFGNDDFDFGEFQSGDFDDPLQDEQERRERH